MGVRVPPVALVRRTLPREAPIATRIVVNPNGPLRVEGECELVDVEGAPFGLGGRPMITLCRCGHSANKPFCDGSHSREALPRPRRRPGPAPSPGELTGALVCPGHGGRVDFARHDNHYHPEDQRRCRLEVAPGDGPRRAGPPRGGQGRPAGRPPGAPARLPRRPRAGGHRPEAVPRRHPPDRARRGDPRELGPGARIGVPQAAGRSLGPERQVRGRRRHRVRAPRRGPARGRADHGRGLHAQARSARRSPTRRSRSRSPGSASRRPPGSRSRASSPPRARWCRWT